MRVKHTSYGKRILNSFVGLLIGVLLFLASFVVLFLNEGRENLATYAKKSMAYDAAQSYSSDDLVYKVGSLSATTFAQDNLLKIGNYIYIERNVEMYGYVEREQNETRENVGGSSTTITTYSYVLQWTTDPKVTSTFKGDQNETPKDVPTDYNIWIANMPQKQAKTATGLSIDGINVSSSGLVLSQANTLTLSSELVKTEDLNPNEVVANGVIYRQNSGEINSPGIGDVRISYKAIIDSDKGILFGSVENQSFNPFITNKGNNFYRFFTGVETQAQAVSILQTEYQTMIWIFRLIGFLMMFFGLLLFATPVTTLLSVLPIFAKIGRFLYGIIAFVIAFTLTTLTILIGIIFNNIYLAAIVVIVLVAVIVMYLKKKYQSKQNQGNALKKKR